MEELIVCTAIPQNLDMTKKILCRMEKNKLTIETMCYFIPLIDMIMNMKRCRKEMKSKVISATMNISWWWRTELMSP